MKASSAAVNTLPVGFIGVLSRIALVVGPNAAASSRARQLPVRRRQPHQPRHGAQQAHHRQIGVVQRLDQHDLVARVEQRHQAGGDRLGGAGGHHHLASPGRPPARRSARFAAATAWRSSGTPVIGGYWLRPSISASAAACSTSAGPSVSGKPWPRLIAPCCTRQRRHHREDRRAGGRTAARSAGFIADSSFCEPSV